jgi:SAM-dependent methyltransferase
MFSNDNVLLLVKVENLFKKWILCAELRRFFLDLLEHQENTIHRHPWELARLSLVNYLLNDQLGQSCSSVLDIGCGDGFILGELAKTHKDISFFGVDTALSKENNALYPHYPGNVKIVSDRQYLERETRLNVVLLLDVLEHIKDDEAFLTDLIERSNFNTQANILITVPSFQALWSKRDVFLKHYRRYKLSHLISKLESFNDWKVQESGYFFSSLILPRVIQILFERAINRDVNHTSVGNWKMNSILSSLLTTSLIIDYKICLAVSKLGLNIPGLSCFVLLQKRS